MTRQRTCAEVEPHLTDYLTRALPPDDDAAVRAHLGSCAACREAARDLARTLDLLRDALTTTAAPAQTLEADRRACIRRARRPVVTSWFANHWGDVLKVAASVIATLGFFGLVLAPMSMMRSSRHMAFVSPEELAGRSQQLDQIETLVEIRDTEVPTGDTTTLNGGIGGGGGAGAADNTWETSSRTVAGTKDLGGIAADGVIVGQAPAKSESPADGAEWGFAVKPPSASSRFSLGRLFGAEAREKGKEAKPADAGWAGTVDAEIRNRPMPQSEITGHALRYAEATPAPAQPRGNEDAFALNGLVAGKTAAAGEKKELVPLETTLPKPLFMGTPKSIRTPNLEPHAGAGDARYQRQAGAEVAAPDAPEQPAKPAAAPERPASLAPAPHEFDSVAVVKSPVVMRGIYGSRSPGTRGSAMKAAPGGPGAAGAGDVWYDDRAAGKPDAARTAAARSDEVTVNFFSDGDARLGLDLKKLEDLNGDRMYDYSGVASGGAVAVDKLARDASERRRTSESAVGRELREDGRDLALKERLAEPASGPAEAAKLGDLAKALVDEKRTEEQVKAVAPTYAPAGFNPYVDTRHNAFSTFAIDVDTAAYAIARRYLNDGQRPPPEAVRTEEFINAFDYDYAPPAAAGAFAVHVAGAPSPFRPSLHVLKIGIKGRRIGRDQHRTAAVTLVIDTSGSMNTPDRLGRIRESIALLVGALDPADRVAVVQFDSQARLVLEHTPAAESARILGAVNALATSGSTHLEGGLRLGYEVAARGFVSGGSNRLILLSDGVANLGSGDAEAILRTVERYRRQGIYASVFGFGAGTYNDALLESLADKGDGAYAFIDSIEEARRLLVDELAATLHVIARDVKIQVEFDPARVARWRQVGYENRALTKEQFRDDTVDAGEVGSGQSVTALYEVELAGRGDAPLGTVRVRYRDVETGRIEELERRVGASELYADAREAPPRFRLALGVAEFAELLRLSPYTAGTDFADLNGWLQSAASALALDAHVKELVGLARAAARLGAP